MSLLLIAVRTLEAATKGVDHFHVVRVLAKRFCEVIKLCAID